MKLLYAVSVLMLVAAGVLFVSGTGRWSPGTGSGELWPEVASIEQLRSQNADNHKRTEDTVPALVAQATQFALYLNPPKPPEPRTAAAPRAKAPQPAPRPVASAPKFRLLLTSCHPARPEQSLALISEPGRGDNWVRQGDRVGHLVVESVKDGTLVYRDGGRLGEVTVTMKQTAELARVASGASASRESDEPDVKLVNASGARGSGVRMPRTQPMDR